MYMKVHHSQIDGVGGVRLLRRILSADPAVRDMLPPWAVGTRGPDQSGTPPKPAPERLPAATGTSRIGSLVNNGAAVAGSLGRTYAESLVGHGEHGRAVPFRAPKTLFNERIHTPRRFATQQYSISRMKAVASAAGGSLNDLFLTLCGGALRRYLREMDALPSEPLTANVPVSVRAETGASVGNAITFLYAGLGTDIDDPLERMNEISMSTKLGKQRLPHVAGAAMDAYTAVLMAPFLSQAILGFGGRGRPASNVVISNVPGPAESRYLDGSRLEELYPISLLFNGQALNITAVSYDDLFNIGFTGCRDSIPHLQRIAVYCGEELEALEKALDL
jgi:WS/DGAT/MGAT family acyltransferase